MIVTSPRDHSLTKPSGLTGDDKPYPVHLHEWTRAEFQEFLCVHRYPPCTFRDRLASHREAVIRALYEGKTVHPHVLADYPDAQDEAGLRHKADTAWTVLSERRRQQVAMFRLTTNVELFVQAIVEEIRHHRDWKRIHHNCYYRATVRFELDGQAYWADLFHVPPLHGRFGPMREEIHEWMVWAGPVGTGCAWEPLFRIEHSVVRNALQPFAKVEVITSQELEKDN